MKNKYAFIYNFKQAMFFINECDLKVDDIGTGTKGDFFVKFVRDGRFEDAFAKWRKGGY